MKGIQTFNFYRLVWNKYRELYPRIVERYFAMEFLGSFGTSQLVFMTNIAYKPGYYFFL